MKGNGDKLKTVKERLQKLNLIASTRSVSRAASNWAVYKTDTDPTTVTDKLDLLGKVAAITGKGSDVVLSCPGDVRGKEDVETVLAALEKNGLNAATMVADLHIPRKRGVLNHRLMYGTLTSPYPEVRVASINQVISTLQVMRDVKCRQLGLWIPDGIDSPGEIPCACVF